MGKKSRIKKKQIRTVEYHLRHYKSYRIAIKNLNRKLDLIMPNITTQYRLTDSKKGAFEVYSTTEEAALDRIESRQAIETKELIDWYQSIVDSIDTALESLTQEEKEFVTLRYFQRLTFAEVCSEMEFSERQVHRIRYNTLDQLLICMSNIKGVNEEDYLETYHTSFSD